MLRALVDRVKFGSLFAGILGWDLALEAHGHETTWASEIDTHCRKVITARRPAIELLGDVREIDAGAPKVDGLCGGFPCQDLSAAGTGAGLTGERSGLFFEYARIIGLQQPKVALIENVRPLLRRGMHLLLRTLHELDYNVDWDCIPACKVGAPHLRDRVWIVAHRRSDIHVFGGPNTLMPFAQAGDHHDIMPRAGVMRDGRIWEAEALAPMSSARRNLWPTPDAGAFGLGTDIDVFNARREREKDKGYNGNGGGATLAVAVQDPGMWPTPTVQDGENNGGPSQFERNSLPLNAAVKQLPTPRATDGDLRNRGDLIAHAKGRANKHHPEKVWPTPEASDGSGGRVSAELGGQRPSGAKRAVSLGTAVAHDGRMLPSPNASDAKGSRRSTARTDDWESNPGETLLDRVSELEGIMWPTPKATVSGPDFARAGREGSGTDDLATRVARGDVKGALNAEWVEWIMGFPTGWTDPDAEPRPHPGWHADPADSGTIARVVANQPNRGPRLRALGNALVWQVAERAVRGMTPPYER